LVWFSYARSHVPLLRKTVYEFFLSFYSIILSDCPWRNYYKQLLLVCKTFIAYILAI